MFFNLKYHITSLVAVFLALGLGMLIGIAMPFNKTLISQHQQLTQSLEGQLISLKQKNSQFKIQIQDLESKQNMQKQFEDQVLPMVVAGKLSGHHIAVIATTGQPMAPLLQLLQTAGADVSSTTVVKNFYNPGKTASPEKTNELTNNESITPEKIAEEVSKAILSGDSNFLHLLSDSGLIHTVGEYGKPLDSIVIFGGTSNKQFNHLEHLDYPMIDFFKSRQMKVYGVEESQVHYSYMKGYQKKKLPTVDNIDTIPGQVALVYAIAGNPGQYGIKTTAKVLLPMLDAGVPVNAK